LLASSPPVAKAKGADPKRASRGALNRATSSRNGERHHPGTPSEIKSEWWATSSRNSGRLPSESAFRALAGDENERLHQKNNRRISAAKRLATTRPKTLKGRVIAIAVAPRRSLP